MKRIKLDVTYLLPALVLTFFVIILAPTAPDSLAAQTPVNIMKASVGAFLATWGFTAMIFQGASLMYGYVTPNETDLITEWEESGE